MNALVLDGHSRAAVEVLHALTDRSVAVDVASERDCLAFQSRRIRNRLRQPQVEQTGAAFIEWLRKVDRESPYALIVPSSEMSLYPFLTLGESDPLKKKAVLPSSESLRTALNKLLTLETALKLQIPVPRTRFVSPGAVIPESDSYPVVLKPISSLVQNGHFEAVRPVVAKDECQRKRHLESMLKKCAVLQQEHVAGRGIGVEMLYCHGKLVWHFAHERLHEGYGSPGLGSGSTYRRSITPSAALLRHSKELLDALKWHGVAQVEFKVADDGRCWLMEINPRFWGSLALAIDSGVDFPWGLLCLALGNQLPPQPDYKIHHYTRHLSADLNWLWTRVVRQGDSKAFVESLRLLRPLIGAETWDHFDWKDHVLFQDLSNFFSEKMRSARKQLSVARRRRLALKMHKENLRKLVGSGRTAGKWLFLCYGNICRSPVAASIAKQLYPQTDICSAGFYPVARRGCPDHVQQVAQRYLIDLSGWSSTRVDVDMVRQADAIFLHDIRDFENFCGQFDGHKDKVLFLGQFADKPTLEIRDPYLSDDKETADIMRVVSESVRGLKAKLVPGASPGTHLTRPTEAIAEQAEKMTLR